MNTEQKIDAIMRYIIAETEEEKNVAASEIKEIMKKSKNVVSNTSLHDIIDDVLLEIGVPCHLKGYNYISYAITLVIENPDYLESVYKELYPAISEKYETSFEKVERGIRNAVERAWDRADPDVIAKYFGNTISPSKGKPVNSEFIARIAKVVKRRIANG